MINNIGVSTINFSHIGFEESESTKVFTMESDTALYLLRVLKIVI
jgi:hypothetical protein